MVDIQKLKSRMVLKGYNQRSLAAEMSARGVKISENTLSSKMKRKSQFDCEEADVICDILDIVGSAEKSDIFLA